MTQYYFQVAVAIGRYFHHFPAGSNLTRQQRDCPLAFWMDLRRLTVWCWRSSRWSLQAIIRDIGGDGVAKADKTECNQENR